MKLDYKYKLKEIRLSKSMKQSELAEKTGLSQNLISNIEREISNMTVQTYIKICIALDCSLEEGIDMSTIPQLKKSAPLGDDDVKRATEIIKKYIDTRKNTTRICTTCLHLKKWNEEPCKSCQKDYTINGKLRTRWEYNPDNEYYSNHAIPNSDNRALPNGIELKRGRK